MGIPGRLGSSGRESGAVLSLAQHREHGVRTTGLELDPESS